MAGSRQRIYGLHAVESALRHQPRQVHHLWLAQGRRDARVERLERLARESGVPVSREPREVLTELAGSSRHQGAVAEVAGAAERDAQSLPQWLEGIAGDPFLLVLDGVQDPHNLGACLRTAEAAGVHGVVLPRDKACGITPVVRKVAAGAAETLPVFRVTNLARALDTIKAAGLWVVGADAAGEQVLYDAALDGPIAWVLGAEGRGLRRLTRERCDLLVRIPMAGTVASLNVSVAAGVCLFETVRRRRAGAGSGPRGAC